MGILTTLDQTRVQWSNARSNEPPDGTYVFRGQTREGSPIYQNEAIANVICIRLSNELIQIADVSLKSLQYAQGGGVGGANYGLTQNPNTVFSYNASSGQISTVKYQGQSGSSLTVDPGAVASNTNLFNIPSYISDKDNNQYYPLNYWFSPGNVQYYSPTPPARIVDDAIHGASSTYVKHQSVENLTAADVRSYANQDRSPDQSAVMGAAVGTSGILSARDHLFQLLKISSEPRSWHWCHLVAHSLRPNHLGQVADNLVAGTAGVNGAMLALEIAVKQFLDEGTKTGKVTYLDYEVQAEVISGTHIAKYIKATIGQWSQSSIMWSYIYYMEATVPERDLTLMTKEHLVGLLNAYNQRS